MRSLLRRFIARMMTRGADLSLAEIPRDQTGANEAVARDQMEEASRCFEQSAKFPGRPGQALAEIGQLLAAKGVSAKALVYLQRALDADPFLADAACDAGLIHMERRQWVDARAFYQQALSVDSQHPRVRVAMNTLRACDR